MSGLNIHVSLKDLSAGLGLDDAVKAFVHDVDQIGSNPAVSADLGALRSDVSAFLGTPGAGADKIVGDIKQLWNDASATGATTTLSDDAGKLLSQTLTGVGEKLMGTGLASTGATLVGAAGAYEAYRAAGDTPGQAFNATLNAIFHGPG